MGRKRITIIDDSAEQVKEKDQKASKKLSDSVENAPEVQTEQPESAAPEITLESKQKKAKDKKTSARGKKYKSARNKIDPNKTYALSEAIKLSKETSFAGFNGSIEAHFIVAKTGLKGEASLPFFQTKAKKVEIATPETIRKIESGKIDFDILISTPDLMPNLVKFAKILGPKGLMPNPKNGTIADDPEKAAKKFQKESYTFRTEPNAPLIHSVIGKTSQKEEELEANLKALIDAIGPKNIKKAVLASSMGPGIKLSL